MVKKPASMIVTPKQVVIGVGIIALLLFVYGYTNRVIENRTLQAQVTQWEQEVRLQEARLADNQAFLEYVQTDAYVIEQARSQLGYTFPDEVAIRTVEQAQPQASPVAPEAAEAAGWRQWWQRFFER
jgi:cell division protein FtsB